MSNDTEPELTREKKLTMFGEGPWLDEPDRLEFQHMGLPCLMTRNSFMGNLCGYVAVPPGHPWHGKKAPPVDVHGSCNYAAACSGRICHVPEPGDPNDVWWFGFDCGHDFDLTPGLFMQLASIGIVMNGCKYRDRAYVEGQIRSLAEQLYALK